MKNVLIFCLLVLVLIILSYVIYSIFKGTNNEVNSTGMSVNPYSEEPNVSIYKFLSSNFSGMKSVIEVDALCYLVQLKSGKVFKIFWNNGSWNKDAFHEIPEGHLLLSSNGEECWLFDESDSRLVFFDDDLAFSFGDVGNVHADGVMSIFEDSQGHLNWFDADHCLDQLDMKSSSLCLRTTDRRALCLCKNGDVIYLEKEVGSRVFKDQVDVLSKPVQRIVISKGEESWCWCIVFEDFSVDIYGSNGKKIDETMGVYPFKLSPQGQIIKS